jgi:hypothetical protein
MEIPLFLLHAVLVPGARLPLKVFEARYVDMVSRCLKNAEPFGICLIKAGREVGIAAVPQRVGTLAHIEQWEMPQQGILLLQVRGGQRFALNESHQQGELVIGEVELWPDEPDLEVPARYAQLVDFLKQLDEGRELPEEPEYNNAAWVSWRLAEVLPVIHDTRQRWLEMRDPVMRLADIQDTIAQLAEGMEDTDND